MEPIDSFSGIINIDRRMYEDADIDAESYVKDMFYRRAMEAINNKYGTNTFKVDIEVKELKWQTPEILAATEEEKEYMNNTVRYKCDAKIYNGGD